jgi:uncharacterized membrane protein YhaH (DUF805 family)
VKPLITEAWYGASFRQAVTRFVQKALRFRGYASRSEFWWVQLMLLVVNLVLTELWQVVVGSGEEPFFSMPGAVVSTVVWLIQLVLLVAQLSLVWHRFHDIGRSGFFFFIAFVPFVGMIAAAFMLALPTNSFGRREKWTDTNRRTIIPFGK